MPSIINAATSGGLISTADTSGVLQLQTASTTAMTINASQNVGIGTASPPSPLTVTGSTLFGRSTRLSGTAGSMELAGNGIAFINDRNGSSNNWSLIQNTATTSGSNLVFTSGTGSMVLDNTGNVGIGVASPAARLDISTTTSYGGIKVNANDGGTISFYQPLSNASARNFRIAPNYEAWGSFDFQKSADNNSAPTTTILSIGTTGKLNLLGASASGGGVGITFPATQSASSDANTLDDYEEGTWTVTTSSTGYTIQQQSGRYIKIGGVVNLCGFVNFSAIGPANSQVVLSGLPFTCNSSIPASGCSRENSTTGAIYMLNVAANGTTVELNSMDGITANSQRTIRANEQYLLSVTYFV